MSNHAARDRLAQRMIEVLGPQEPLTREGETSWWGSLTEEDRQRWRRHAQQLLAPDPDGVRLAYVRGPQMAMKRPVGYWDQPEGAPIVVVELVYPEAED